MFETIVTIAVVAFVLVICGISLYRTFTGKGRGSCSSCCGDGSCCMKRDVTSEKKKP